MTYVRPVIFRTQDGGVTTYRRYAAYSRENYADPFDWMRGIPRRVVLWGYRVRQQKRLYMQRMNSGRDAFSPGQYADRD